MKKKKWILIMMAGMVFSYTQATISNLNDGYVVQLEIVDHGHSGPDTPLTPVQPPQVSVSGHTIYFTGTHNGFTLDLLDENNIVAYHTTLTISTSNQTKTEKIIIIK